MLLILMKRGRGVSPIIATVLLIAMVIIIGVIFLLYFKSFREETVTKFEKNIKLVCEEVRFSASYDETAGTLSVTNDGNVPIFNIEIKRVYSGGYESKGLSGLVSNWPSVGLNQGDGFSESISSYVASGTEKIILIPVLIGNSEKGKKSFMCDEQYGYEINV